MNASIFKKIEFVTVAVGVLMAIVFYFWQGASPAVSALLGCALGLLNFIGQRLITAQMVRRAATGGVDGLPAPVLFILKYLAAGVAIYIILGIERVDVIGFAAGFLSFVVAIVAVGGNPRMCAVSEPGVATSAPESGVE